MDSLTNNPTDGGGIHGLSGLLIVKEVMHKVMVDENKKLKQNGQPPLTRLPKPCDPFNLIAGTGTGGCASCFKYNALRLIFALQDNCFDAWAASDGRRHSNKTL